jgi:nitroreductase
MVVMPSRRAVSMGSAGLALAALGYRAWDRGVFAGATGQAYAPWDKWRGTETDGLHRPLRAAILAASPHNTQPWLFTLSTSEVAVYADRTRHLGTFDPFRREMHLGLGCAIENFVHAARVFGIATDVNATPGRLELMPVPQAVLAARIALYVGQPAGDSSFDALPKRHTNRGPYRDQAPAPEQLRVLRDLTTAPNVRVIFISENGARRELGSIIVNATERIIADPEMSMDSFRWIRTGRRQVEAHRDGITIDASGTSRLQTIAGKMLPDFGAARTDQIWLETTRDVHTATAPVYGLILVPDRMDMPQAIDAGRAWQRLHLAATAQGLVAQPLNQPVEMIDRNQMLGRNDEFGPALAALARAEGWEPTFVFRLGYAEREAPRSPRRPLPDVIRIEDARSGRAGHASY